MIQKNEGGHGGGGQQGSRSQRSNGGMGGVLTPTSAKTPKRQRFVEPQKLLPVIFVIVVIAGLWAIYGLLHCARLLQLGGWRGSGPIDEAMRSRGAWQTIVFHYFTALLLVCHVRSILVHPGEIPENDPHWEYLPRDGRSPTNWIPMGLQEMKKSGMRRHCKWCGKYKPDRCHHCRVCKTCILKMDHHCPWIYNCVGFYNYKFFFLLLFYTVLDCFFIVFTMAESVKRCFDEPSTHFAIMFFTLFGETLAFFLAVLATMFFGFHIWLMLKAMTTIEFCEKSSPKKEGEGKSGQEQSMYDLGVIGNVRVILGENILLWFFPCSRLKGDGMNFVSEETRLTSDMESSKGIRRRGHQKTPRTTSRRNTGELSDTFTPSPGSR